jgi:hypothetical protein
MYCILCGQWVGCREMPGVAAIMFQYPHQPFHMDWPLDECQKDKSHDMFAGEDKSCPDRGRVCKPTDGAWNVNKEALTR